MRTREDVGRVADALRRKASSAREIGSLAEADAFATKAIEIEEKHALNVRDDVLTMEKLKVMFGMVDDVAFYRTSPIKIVFRDVRVVPAPCDCAACRRAKGGL